MKPLEDAQREVLEGTRLLPEVTLKVEEALGLVTTVEVTADRDLPPFPNSAMDGYAVIGADVQSAPATLAVAGESAAGHPTDVVVTSGRAVRIMTGAAMPNGADTIVKVEDTEPGDGSVTVLEPTPVGTSVRSAGSDVRAGTVVLSAGTQLNLNHLGVLAALGLTEVAVRRRPRVAVLSTGDEVLAADTPVLGPGQIRDTNRPMLIEAVREVGADPVDMGIISDDEGPLRSAFLDAAEASDLIISSGGVSMGDYDLVKRILAETGDIDFWKVAMKPAKPFAFGRIGSTPFFGLPGNPVSVMVAFEQFARPALLAMMGATKVFRPRLRGTISEPVSTDPEKTVFLRMTIEGRSPEHWMAAHAGEQGSHVLSALAAADAFAVIHRGTGDLPAGSSVDLEMFRWPAARTAAEALG